MQAELLYFNTSVFELFMSKIDGRKIPHGVRETIRMEAIQKWLDGATVKSLAEKYGTDESWVVRRMSGLDL